VVKWPLPERGVEIRSRQTPGVMGQRAIKETLRCRFQKASASILTCLDKRVPDVRVGKKREKENGTRQEGKGQQVETNVHWSSGAYRPNPVPAKKGRGVTDLPGSSSDLNRAPPSILLACRAQRASKNPPQPKVINHGQNS